MKVYGIKTCGTYKKAIKWFADNSIEFETVDLREEPPSKDDLARYHQLSGLELKKFFNTSGKLYRELDLKNKQKTLSNDQIYQLLADNPMLIKRPLVIDRDYVRTGFNEGEYKNHWKIK
jgi:arsenate reductase